MEAKITLQLCDLAWLLNQNGDWGVQVGSGTIWAANAAQRTLLQELARSPQSVAQLEAALQAAQPDLRQEGAAIALADFILTFGDAIREKEVQ